jgi:hypothetical protein
MTDPRQRVAARPPSAGPVMDEREQVLARRRLTLIILILLVPVTLVAAIVTGSTVVLVLNLLADVLIAVYVAMLLQIKQTQGGSERSTSDDGRAVDH